MAIRKRLKKELDQLKKKLQDKKTQEKIKSEVRKRFEQGKAKFKWLEKQVRDKENQRKVRAELAKFKRRFKQHEKKAAAYTKKNPRKALAVAAAAGVLAGTFLSILRRRK